MKVIGALLVVVVGVGLVTLMPADANATGLGWNNQHHDQWKSWGDDRDHHVRRHIYRQYPAPVYVVPSHAKWVPGYWAWNGYQWVWVAGYWVW